MAIIFSGNVIYEGPKAFVAREEFSTKQAMLDFPKTKLNSGLIAFCHEDKKHYKFIRTESDLATGTWSVLLEEGVNNTIQQAISTAKSEAITDAVQQADTSATAKFLPKTKEAELVSKTELQGKGYAVATEVEETYAKKAEMKTVTVESSGLTHVIKFGQDTVGTINIPKDLFATNLAYDAVQKKLILTVNNEDGDNAKTVEVNVADLVNTYEAGTGLQLQGNVFSLDADTQGKIAKIDTIEGKVTALEGKAVVATTSTDGLMSSADKTKLDSLNDYTLPQATAEALGGVKIGYTNNGAKRAVQLDENGKAYVDTVHFHYITTKAEFDQMQTQGTLDPMGIYFTTEE